MSPQNTTLFTSFLVGLCSAIAAIAASKGIIGIDDQASFANSLVAVLSVLAAVAVAIYKRIILNRALSQNSMIKAINSSTTNGVKVVPESSPTPAVNEVIEKTK